MLTPHDGEDSELGEIGIASEDFFDALEFFRRQSMLRHQLRRHGWIDNRIGHRHRTLANLVTGSNCEFLRILAALRESKYERPHFVKRPRSGLGPGQIKTKGPRMKRRNVTLACAIKA